MKFAGDSALTHTKVFAKEHLANASFLPKLINIPTYIYLRHTHNSST